MYPVASNANGVSRVHFPSCAVTYPRASILAVHIVRDNADAQLIAVGHKPVNSA